MLGTDTVLQPGWKYGWAMAASYTDEDFKDATIEPLDLKKITNVNATSLPSTGSSKVTQKNISTLLISIDELRPKLAEQISNILLLSTNDENIQTNFKNKANILASISVNTIIGSHVITAAGTGVKAGESTKFLGSFATSLSKYAGRGVQKNVAKLMNAGVGATFKLFRLCAKGLSTGFMFLSNTKVTLDDAKKVQILGTSIGAVGAAANFIAGIFNSPGFAEILGLSIIILNIITLGPQVAMAIALILWLVQVVAWFLMIPISTLIIAIPNTNVGHSSWRQALALALTPCMIMLFYLVSLFVNDMVIDISTTAIFQPYIKEFASVANSSGAAFALDSAKMMAGFILDIFTGELLFRIIAWAVLLTIGFTFSLMLIIRGPNWFFQKVGLNSNMGELGGDFESASHRLSFGLNRLGQ